MNTLSNVARASLALVALAAVAAPATAAEAYADYDPLNTPLLSRSKWNPQLERTRVVAGGKLNLIQRDFGNQVSDTGVFANSWTLDFARPATVRQIQAWVTPLAAEVTGCAQNTTASDVQIRLAGSFFSVGGGAPGNQINDVVALTRLIRRSDSTDPAGVMKVEGVVVQCTSSDCVDATPIVPTVDLGTASVGTAVLLRLSWDQAVKKFVFRRDGTTISSQAYAVPDVVAPSVPFKHIGSRTRLANCFSGTPTTGYTKSTFDTISVNTSATQ